MLLNKCIGIIEFGIYAFRKFGAGSLMEEFEGGIVEL
jgi:hypothetical protein